MKKLPLLEIAAREEELYKCVNCGLCQSVCPTYLVTGHEGKTARGKILLMRGLLEDLLEPSVSISNIFDDCLTCYACQTVCPAGVKTERLWTSARQDLASSSLTTWIKRIGLRLTIGKPWIFNKLAHLAGLSFGFNRDNHRGAVLKGRLLFPFSGAPYLRSLKEEYEPVEEVSGSVGLLLGCSSNLFTPWVVDAAIKLLNAAGWRVIIPHDQVCCGAPAINNGDWKTAKRLAKENIQLFNDLEADYITSCDATCAGAFIKDYLEIFANDEEFLKEAKRLSSKTLQLGQLLDIALDANRLRFNPIKTSITIHDSCHSTHLTGGPGWRKLLQTIEGISIIEMNDSDHCCGFGGSYTFFHPNTAAKIAEQKLLNARETDVKQVLVGSPGCMIRLQSPGVNPQNNQDIEIRHVAELLAELVNTFTTD